MEARSKQASWDKLRQTACCADTNLPRDDSNCARQEKVIPAYATCDASKRCLAKEGCLAESHRRSDPQGSNVTECRRRKENAQADQADHWHKWLLCPGHPQKPVKNLLRSWTPNRVFVLTSSPHTCAVCILQSVHKIRTMASSRKALGLLAQLSRGVSQQICHVPNSWPAATCTNAAAISSLGVRQHSALAQPVTEGTCAHSADASGAPAGCCCFLSTRLYAASVRTRSDLLHRRSPPRLPCNSGAASRPD